MKKLLIGAMILGLASLAYPQSSTAGPEEVELGGVTVSPFNLDYLYKVKEGTVAPKVLKLQHEVASFDIKTSDLYKGSSKTYRFTFEQSDGRISATFDGQGKIMHSYERFRNVIFPMSVRNSIYKEYPGWFIQNNTYIVSYSQDGKLNKTYKVRIGKGNLQKKLKIHADGRLLLALRD